MTSKKIIIAFILFFAFILVVVAAFTWWTVNSIPVTTESQGVRVVIPKGTSAGEIAQILEESKVIKSALAFKFYIQLTGEAGSIQAGEYTLDPSMSMQKIIEDLTGGPDLLWVTVQEGLRKEEIPAKFAQGLGLTDEQSMSFAEGFLASAEGLEGYLFPDTYLVPKDIEPSVAVSLMRNTFDTKTAGFGVVEGSELERIVIIASLIERESKGLSERPGIAGVIENRLDLGMPLQIDATVQYALANERCTGVDCNWWEAPLRADLEFDSPYNTYLVTGLPPSPISNPGIASLEAAANPEEHDYLFYIHDRQNNIHFAKDFDEHNQNIARYLR